MKSLLCVLCVSVALQAETGVNAWLRYVPSGRSYDVVVAAFGDSPLIESARQELVRGLSGINGRAPRTISGMPNEDAIILGAAQDLPATLRLQVPGPPDTYWLKASSTGKFNFTVVTSATPRGVLYGAFALLRKMQLGQSLDNLNDLQAPYAPVRWINHWENLEGTIERGYGGRSNFWENGKSREDLSRVTDYARMLASLGINACSITNVNANPRAISPEFLPHVARIAGAFRPWGVRVALAVDFGSPKSVGGLDTFDPLDPKVVAWWKTKAEELYAAVPDLAGIVIKADSEGRVGPSAYGRTHADAANVVARAIAPRGGLLFYRGFVYDHHMDWRNLKNDRARAAADNFRELDGKFDGNVIIQIKHGPIDFQVREPASPLFGTLEKSNQAIELQITQEYFGQGRHTVFLVPMWKDVLDFDLQARGAGTPVKALVAGKTFGRPGGFVGVSNVGRDESWFGNHMSQANLYGFGRLAWNPNLTSKQIIDEWTRLTFGNDSKVVETITAIQLSSWRTYENYTGPLGLQTLTDIVGNHYGVAVEASERNGWGQWHRADDQGVGMDRTAATGTGFIGQYRAAVARVYESLATCPDELLLFMHHVPYTHLLHSGKTVIQFIYDSHYEGAETVNGYARQWRALQGRVDEQRYNEILTQLEYQTGQAQVWRDAVSNWFLRASGIPDAQGRVGHYPGRTEAESMSLEGYAVRDVTPWEAASGGKAVTCAASRCTATYRFDGAAGSHTVRVRYFDQNNGVSRFRLWVAGQMIAEWAADDRVPSRKVDSSSSARRVFSGVALRPGDEIRVEGMPDGGESAALDYIEIEREVTQ